MTKLGNPPSLTEFLLQSVPDAFETATRAEFLSLAAAGRLERSKLGVWLTFDRLYIHRYLVGTGRLLEIASRDVPHQVDLWPEHATTKLIDWLTDSMVNIRREERFFIDTAAKYGISLNTESYNESIPAVGDFEKIFSSINGFSGQLPWLEGAIIFWATEKCYLEAWSWAKAQALSSTGSAANITDDLDGGAMRKEFIPNWTSPEFVAFVQKLGDLIDEAVRKELEWRPTEEESIICRSLATWNQVLAAEAKFWPKI